MMSTKKQLKPGDWIEVRDPSKRVSYGIGGTGIFRVIKMGRVNVKAETTVRFSPTGPWYHQEHTIPLDHVVRVVPENELKPKEPALLENPAAPNLAGYLILAGFAAAALYALFRPKKAAAAASCPIITPESLEFYNETFKIAVVQLADETEPPVGRVGTDNRITLYSYADGTFLPFGTNGTPQTFSQPLIVIVGEDRFWRYEGAPGQEASARLSPEDRENYCKLLLGERPATVSGIRWM